MRLKLKRSRQVLCEILPVMTAGIQVKFMGNAARRQQLVELRVAFIEAKIILGAAIEIDREARRPRPILHNRKRTFAFPECRVHPRTESLAQHLRHRRGLIAGHFDVRQRLNQRGAVRAHRHEQIGVTQRKPQRPIPSHRNAGDAARLPFRAHPVVALDIRQKFADEKILIAHLAIARINVEGPPAVRRNNQKFANPFLIAQILNHVHAAGIEQQLLIPAQPVQEIDRGIGVGLIGVVVGRKNHAIRNSMPQNLARRRTALRPSRRGTSWRNKNRNAHNQRSHQTQRPPAALTHTAVPRRDSNAPPAMPDTSPPPNSRKMKPQSPAPPSTSGSTIYQWAAAPAASSTRSFRSSAHVRSAIPSPRPPPLPATPSRPLPQKTNAARRDPLPPAPSEFQSRAAVPESPSPAYSRCPTTPPSAPNFQKSAAANQTP